MSAILVAMLFVALDQGGAQQRPRTPVSTLSADSRAAIERIIDSARVAGLPTEPLSDKVLEGTLKGADEQRIVAAVRSLARELGIARTLLPGPMDKTLLGATASALHAGLSNEGLSRLIRTSRESRAESGVLASALVVLVDIVARRVPPDLAISSMENLLAHGAQERQFVALRSEVEQAIGAGRTPVSAIQERMSAQLHGSPDAAAPEQRTRPRDP